jgi:DNA-directed RNA polymerase specialized sigma24 family protein
VMSGGAEPRPPDAFEAFYRRAWRDAVRWAAALTGSVAAGEDLAQDAFARVRSRFASIDNADGYLRATIVNLARDQCRATDRRSARELRVVGEPVLDRPSMNANRAS